jgi:phosphonate transport system substrate-binding protein
LAVMVLVSMLLASCAPAATPTAAPTQPPPAPTQPPAATDTPVPAPTATIPAPVCAALPDAPTVAAGALGSSGNPIAIVFVPSGDSGKIAKAGTSITDCLNKMTGLTFTITVSTSYTAAVEAMGANKAQVGFLSTFAIVAAEQKYGVVPVLANLRKYATTAIDPDNGLAGQLEPFYKGEFITKADSGIKTLADLKGKTFCFVDPASASGYIVPRIFLKANGIDPDKDLGQTTNAGSHPNVAIAVYNGDCEAGVAYVDILTDTSANLVAKYPDIATKVTIFAVTDKIPNDGVQVTKDLDPKLTAVIVEAMTAMPNDPGAAANLRALYNVNAFQKIDGTFYDGFNAMLKKAGVDPATMFK